MIFDHLHYFLAVNPGVDTLISYLIYPYCTVS